MPQAGLAKQTVAFSTSLSSLWLEPPACGFACSVHSQEAALLEQATKISSAPNTQLVI